MAKRGYSLALTARRLDLLEIVRADIVQRCPSVAVEIRPLDVSDYDAVFAVVRDLVGALGGLDIVFANAGVGLNDAIGKGQFERSRRNIEVNLIGAMATVDAAVGHFLERGSGHVVGNCSVAAFRGMARNSSYGASKAGLAHYLEALRVEVYRKDIDVTVLYPGYIDTPLADNLRDRPFAISAEKAAAIIADKIERKARSATIPVFPWNIIGRLLKVLPLGAIAKL
jgi:short-subunit dehydrogenase